LSLTSIGKGHLFDPFVLDKMWLLFKEEFEDTKGVIRIRISKKKRQHNGQKKKGKQRSIKHTHKRHLTFGGWGIFLFVKKKSLEFNRKNIVT
jgi:hypothetical protein